MTQAAKNAAIGFNYTATPYASLPTAATESGSVFYCTDGPGGPALWLSDGNYWRPFARGIQRFIGTTGANGQVTWTFGTPFTAKPVLNYMIENTGANGMLAEIISYGTSSGNYISVTIQLKQAAASLLGVLGAILSVTAAPAGVVCHMSASLPTQ